MLTFTSTGPWIRVKGRGFMAIVECDLVRNRDDPGLVGERVIIDDEEFIVAYVEAFRPTRPIAKGESIGLVVKEVS